MKIEYFIHAFTTITVSWPSLILPCLPVAPDPAMSNNRIPDLVNGWIVVQPSPVLTVVGRCSAVVHIVMEMLDIIMTWMFRDIQSVTWCLCWFIVPDYKSNCGRGRTIKELLVNLLVLLSPSFVDLVPTTSSSIHPRISQSVDGGGVVGRG